MLQKPRFRNLRGEHEGGQTTSPLRATRQVRICSRAQNEDTGVIAIKERAGAEPKGDGGSKALSKIVRQGAVAVALPPSYT